MASRCPREKGNISLAGRPITQVIGQLHARLRMRAAPPFIDTFRAKTTDIAKREPITKAGFFILSRGNLFLRFAPRLVSRPPPALRLFPSLFFSPSRFFFCSTTSSGECYYGRTTSLTDSGSIYSQMPRPRRKMDDPEAWLSRSRGICGSSSDWEKWEEIFEGSFYFSLFFFFSLDYYRLILNSSTRIFENKYYIGYFSRC